MKIISNLKVIQLNLDYGIRTGFWNNLNSEILWGTIVGCVYWGIIVQILC